MYGMLNSEIFLYVARFSGPKSIRKVYKNIYGKVRRVVPMSRHTKTHLYHIHACIIRYSVI